MPPGSKYVYTPGDRWFYGSEGWNRDQNAKEMEQENKIENQKPKIILLKHEPK